MGERLRERLRAEGWVVVNETPLPVVCFVDAKDRSSAFLDAVAADVSASGDAWLSTVLLGGESGAALRACICHFATGPDDLEALVAALGRARGRQGGATPV